MQDLCPNVPEDLDRFEDGDGCRDNDNDRDRILDAEDLCPDESEVYQGCDDEDGCPDSSTSCCPDVPFVPPIVEWVEFRPGSAAPRADAEDDLDGAAERLVDLLGPIVGHAAVLACALPGEDDRDGLAERRARRIVDELVERGVDVLRLESHGMPDCEALWNVRVWPLDPAGEPPARPFARVFVTTVCQSDGTGCMEMMRWDGATLQIVEHICI
ncbi:MAG: hypothetical protein HY905_24025 [Deltaproteobacteria bacterium]|nr:hypothetical protein [Deltaproteobacteria bacterium]